MLSSAFRTNQMSARILASHFAERAQTRPGAGHWFETFWRRAVHPNQAKLNLYVRLVNHMRGWIATANLCLLAIGRRQKRIIHEGIEAEQPRRAKENVC